jgi:Domain of unknown function (DUF1963)
MIIPTPWYIAIAVTPYGWLVRRDPNLYALFSSADVDKNGRAMPEILGNISVSRTSRRYLEFSTYESDKPGLTRYDPEMRQNLNILDLATRERNLIMPRDVGWRCYITRFSHDSRHIFISNTSMRTSATSEQLSRVLVAESATGEVIYRSDEFLGGVYGSEWLAEDRGVVFMLSSDRGPDRWAIIELDGPSPIMHVTASRKLPLPLIEIEDEWGFVLPGLGSAGGDGRPAPAVGGRRRRARSEASVRTAGRKVLRERFGTDVAKQLMADAQIGVRLVHDLGGRSWVGGWPRLMSADDWPVNDGQPLVFVAQLDVTDLRSVWGDCPIPDVGSLAFFYDPFEASAELAPTVVRVPELGSAIEVVREDLDEEQPFPEVRVRPELVLTVVVDPTSTGTDDDGELRAEAQDLLEPSDGPRHQVGGHAAWIQDPEELRRAMLLLRLDSDDRAGMTWGDAGGLLWVIPPDALADGDFSRVEGWLDCY